MQPELRNTALGNYHSNSQGAAQGRLEVGNAFQAAVRLDFCVFGFFHSLAKIIELSH